MTVAWHEIRKGNVVRWSQSVWLVANVKTTGLDLISLRWENVSAGPSLYWPWIDDDDDDSTTRAPDPRRNVESVVKIADTVAEYVRRVALSPFSELLS